MYWRIVKYTPKIIVKKRNLLHSFLFPVMIKWWAAVKVIPDLRRIIVFINGILIGLNDLIPLHGQFCPIKISGERHEWKKAQKKDKKKNTSDVMNRIIPILSPERTSFVCIPSKVDSRTTSRHHLHEIRTNKIRLMKNIVFDKCPLKFLAVEKTVLKSWKEVKIGHGLRVTKWNGIFGISFQNLKTF